MKQSIPQNPQVPKLLLPYVPALLCSNFIAHPCLGKNKFSFCFICLFLQHLLMSFLPTFLLNVSRIIWSISLQTSHQPSVLLCTLQKPFEEVFIYKTFSTDETSIKIQEHHHTAINSSLFTCYFIISLLRVTDLILCPLVPRLGKLVTWRKANINLCSSKRGSCLYRI